jgi:hypothetical protein
MLWGKMGGKQNKKEASSGGGYIYIDRDVGYKGKGI